MRSDIIDVTLHYRRESASGLATAFWNGETDKSGKEVWVWLPNSVIEIERKKVDVCEVSLPEKLALEKGLI